MEAGDQAILTGADALKVVAQPNGEWNWALVGPDPDKLPLVGGGSGSIVEMRECLTSRAVEQAQQVYYGLLRLSFGTGRLARQKYIMVQITFMEDDMQKSGDASDKPAPPAGEDELPVPSPAQIHRKKSMISRGQAIGKRPAMEKALSSFVHYTIIIEANHMDDLTVEEVIERVAKVSSVDAEVVTNEGFFSALKEFKESLPEPAPEESSVVLEAPPSIEPEARPDTEAEAPPPVVEEAVEEAVEEVKPEEKRTSVAEPILVPEIVPEAAPKPAAPVQAKSSVNQGDYVQVYSSSVKSWVDDGLVLEILTESSTQDGLSLPPGTAKIQYAKGLRYKWVTPEQQKDHLKPSNRPRVPTPLKGELLKETHNFITEWHVRHFELSQGFLQWWMKKEDAVKGKKSNTTIELTGLQLRRENTKFYLRTASSKGVVYAFDATTMSGATAWTTSLQEHAKYCTQIRAYLQTKK